MNGVSEVSARHFANRIIPDSSLCSQRVTALARRLLMYRLACLPALYVDDVLMPIVHESPDALARETCRCRPISDEWCVSLHAFISAHTFADVVNAFQLLKGCVRSNTSRIGSLKLRDALRPESTLRPTLTRAYSLARSFERIA
jgi:hypothetical protein